MYSHCGNAIADKPVVLKSPYTVGNRSCTYIMQGRAYIRPIDFRCFTVRDRIDFLFCNFSDGKPGFIL